jgi:hypothetical protein
MQENVGTTDRVIRAVAGPALIVSAFSRFGAARGRTAGLAALVAGALIVESAITRVCPVSAMVGIDTR